MTLGPYEKRKPFKFSKEADLCSAFLDAIPDDWIAYNETGDFDILLVHRESQVQIGIEAKLVFNTKVLCQAMESRGDREYDRSGPDYRAVLVGKSNHELRSIASNLGITVLSLDVKFKAPKRGRFDWPDRQGPDFPRFELSYDSRLPEFRLSEYLPDANVWIDRVNWYDLAPTKRITLPEYVPDVEAGHPSPQKLSTWKIQAIKVCIWVEKQKTINRAQFKQLKIDPGRWMDGYWLQKSPIRGLWIAGKHFPAESYRKQHPSIYRQIEADFDAWSTSCGLVAVPTQEALI